MRTLVRRGEVKINLHQYEIYGIYLSCPAKIDYTSAIDEQLLSSIGRCPSKMYIHLNPDKYGIKIVMMCDAKTSYMYNDLSYLGREIKAGNKNEGKPKSGHSKELLIPLTETRD
ncbi:hypothetical protein JTB14_005652 [Gonioctena quinquepunctata]|nr:hypothetical protein JTB14_005652 [Gonioctena quinquepunctata]